MKTIKKLLVLSFMLATVFTNCSLTEVQSKPKKQSWTNFFVGYCNSGVNLITAHISSLFEDEKDVVIDEESEQSTALLRDSSLKNKEAEEEPDFVQKMFDKIQVGTENLILYVSRLFVSKK